MPTQWFPFLYGSVSKITGLQPTWACMVRHINSSFLVHHCQAILHQNSTVFLVLNFEGSCKIFPVSSSWVLFLCFVFSSHCCATDFRQCLQIFCGFFPSSRRFCAKMVQFAFYCTRMLHDCCRFDIFCSTGFYVGFKVPSLPFGLLKSLEFGFWKCSVCYESQESICFFFGLCKFPLVLQACQFCVLWILRFCCFCLFSYLSPNFLSNVWVSNSISHFPHRLATVFVCLTTVLVVFGKAWQVCRSNFLCRPRTRFLGPKMVEIFCQVLEGSPECRKKFIVNTMLLLSLSPRVQILRLPWLLTRNRDFGSFVLVLQKKQ